MLHILKIPIPGQVRGGSPPRPWVAMIEGLCGRFGLRRRFIKPLNDFSNATCAGSGNIYGVVAHFALRDGELYEVSGYRDGYLCREFLAIDEGQRVDLPREEAIEWLSKKDC